MAAMLFEALVAALTRPAAEFPLQTLQTTGKEQITAVMAGARKATARLALCPDASLDFQFDECTDLGGSVKRRCRNSEHVARSLLLQAMPHRDPYLHGFQQHRLDRVGPP